MIKAMTVCKLVFLFTVLLLAPNLQAEVRGSSNFKIQADGITSATNMASTSFKLFSILGDGRAVKLSNSGSYKLGSSVVYVIGGRSIEDSLCFPIRLQSKKSAVVCL